MARRFTKTSALNTLELGIGGIGAKINGKSILSFAIKGKFYTFDTAGGTVDRMVNVTMNSSTTTGLLLAFAATGKFRVGARSVTADTFATATDTASLSTGVWYDFGGVFDFPNDDMFAYVNGVLKASNTGTGWANTTYTNGTPTIPDNVSYPGSADSRCDADLAELAIWDVNIGVEGFAQLAAGSSPLLVLPGNLLAYMPIIGRHSPEIDLVGDLQGTIPVGGTVNKSVHPRVFLPTQFIPQGLQVSDTPPGMDGEGQVGTSGDATLVSTPPVTLGQAKMFARAGIARAGATRSGYYFQNVIILVNGVDVSNKLWRNTLRVEDIINEQADLANLTFFDLDVTHGQQLIIALGSSSNRIFGGTIQRPKPLYPKGGQDKGIVTVSATDWTFMLNRRRVYKRYTALNLHQIFADIIQNFTSGFTTLNIKSPSPNIPEIEFSGEYVATALTRAAQMGGWDWYVDPGRDVHLFDVEAITQPKALTPTNYDYWNLDHLTDWSQIRTRVYVQGGGSLTTVSTAAGSSEISLEDTVWYSETGGQVQFGGQIINYTGKTATQIIGIPVTGTGSITHRIPAGSNINIRVMRQDTAAQTAALTAAGEGDGVHEYTVTDQRLSIDGAIARADAELAMFKDPVTQGSYQTFERNIRSGSDLVVNLPGRLVGTFKVTKVVSELAGPGRIRRTVSFSSSLPQDFYALLRSASSIGEAA